MLAEQVDVVIGVDTHKHTHTAAAIASSTGAALAHTTVTADAAGYAELIAFADQHASSRGWAIEGAGGYGAGLTRHLTDCQEIVLEIDRPKRPKRRAGAKTDLIDAERAAREALARDHLAQPKTGAVRAALQMRLAARRAAVTASADAQKQLLALVVTAPQRLRDRFAGQRTPAVIATAAKLRATTTGDVEYDTAVAVLRALARRIQDLQTEAATHQTAICALVRSWRPDLLDQPGIGPIVAATVLTAWSHAGRCRNDGAFAMLAGAAPIPASSGMTVRYRLNRAGDRHLNQALHTITLTRLKHDPATRAYAERRRKEGKSDRDIRRCLKRYICRDLYRRLEHQSPLDAS
ncbi:transposase [Blastococcus sp. CCUG 61487]|uniref:transposase n=1 Tax=Blastococcus sp. CCUG 61487 TaxID=1840703 RepID=UPI00201E1640|nr:transposase [Blastococcus sp. CCUG 61487]